jgi:hypothetical protein
MLLALLACTPTFNWRQVRAEPAPASVLMPCKPERGERHVAMTEAGTDLRLMRCETGGLTFALAWARLTPQDDREAVLQRWHRASLASWQAPETALAPPPADARPGLRHRWEGTGRNHRGEPLPLRVAYFAQGDWVYQMLVAGVPRSEEPVVTFMDSLQ